MAKAPRETSPLPYRLAVTVRTVAAIAGGYALAALSAVSLARILPLERADAGLLATMLAFIIFTVAVIWAYSAGSLKRVWGGLVLAAVVMALPLLVHGGQAS